MNCGIFRLQHFDIDLEMFDVKTIRIAHQNLRKLAHICPSLSSSSFVHLRQKFQENELMYLFPSLACGSLLQILSQFQLTELYKTDIDTTICPIKKWNACKNQSKNDMQLLFLSANQIRFDWYERTWHIRNSWPSWCGVITNKKITNVHSFAPFILFMNFFFQTKSIIRWQMHQSNTKKNIVVKSQRVNSILWLTYGKMFKTITTLLEQKKAIEREHGNNNRNDYVVTTFV